jgi:hypothetical protein
MGMATLLAAGLVTFTPLVAAHQESERACLARAVLAESTLAKEPVEGDLAVGYSIYMRQQDGRWGKTICEVVNKRYSVTRIVTKTVKVQVKKKGKKPSTASRTVKQSVTRTVCDYSFNCIDYYKGIMAKAAPAQRERAFRVADTLLSGDYEPPSEILLSLHYQYRAYSSKNGSKWFDCTAKPLGKPHPESVHLHYRDATNKELDEILKQDPKGCTKYIATFRNAIAKNQAKRSYAAAR